MWLLEAFILVACVVASSSNRAANCRERSGHIRLDGGQCFEIPDWQHEPVELEDHLRSLKDRWGPESLRRKIALPSVAMPFIMSSSEVTRYMDTVLAPFLDTYHRNIQDSYQQMTQEITKKIKDEMNQAMIKKKKIYDALMKLADKLKIPAMCDEERRDIKTVSSKHVAQVYACTEAARATITKMARYAEEMITLTRNHMQTKLDDATKALDRNLTVRTLDDHTKSEIADCLTELSEAAVSLGYELDLSLTNARRHNEQSCEKLSSCGGRVRRQSEENVSALRDRLYQCVYA